MPVWILTSAVCPEQNFSASKQGFYPNIIWTSTTLSLSSCVDSAAYRAYGLEGGSWYASWFCATIASASAGNPYYTHFGSVRCGFRIYLPKGIRQGGCSASSVSGIPLCPWQSISASKQVHAAYLIWSSTAYTDNNCADSGKAYYTSKLDGTSLTRNGLCATTRADSYAGYTNFGSVRCVLALE